MWGWEGTVLLDQNGGGNEWRVLETTKAIIWSDRSVSALCRERRKGHIWRPFSAMARNLESKLKVRKKYWGNLSRGMKDCEQELQKPPSVSKRPFRQPGEEWPRGIWNGRTGDQLSFYIKPGGKLWVCSLRHLFALKIIKPIKFS